MDKKTVNFLFTCAIVLIVFASLNRMLFPPPPLDENAVVDDSDQGEDIPAEADSDADAAQLADSQTDEEAEDPDADTVASTLASQQRGSMGSLDPASGYNMLVTWNNRGGSIERIELNSPKYTSIDEKYGYLGHLALSERTKGGCVVGAVGSGTPAALAKSSGQEVGIQPGDVVLSLDDRLTNSIAEFQNAIEATRPGQVVKVVVERQSSGSVANISFDVTLAKRPLEVVRPEPELPTETDPQHPLSYLLEVSQIGSRTIGVGKSTITGVPNLSNGFWQANALSNGDTQTVEFTYVLGDDVLREIGYSGSVEIVKRFSLAPATREDGADGYHLNFEVEFRNQTGDSLDLGYRLQGPTGLPVEGAWYAYKVHPTSFAGAGLRDVVYRFDGPHHMMPNPKVVKHAQKHPKSPGSAILEGVVKPLRYVSVDGQYFESALVPERPAAENPNDPISGFEFRELTCFPAGNIAEDRRNKTDITYFLDSNPETLQADRSFKQSFKIFAGPKNPDVLELYGLEETISYGWFAPIAKGLTWVLH
ncbi:MAG: YidC/Oxa1 family insertase periplasmic-domain containing protein, partial [Planctomycetales bacterium]|nr:YidC/Oxa1 family insertase periplasmic-domain containing protein [Planctomycetales bacterium]